MPSFKINHIVKSIVISSCGHYINVEVLEFFNTHLQLQQHC